MLNPGIELCASGDLAEKGPAVVFDVREYGRVVQAFAVRFEGRVVAYLNRCAHVPSEMDWKPGEFFDGSGRWLMCATHGAIYHPHSGACARGPCDGRRLRAIRVEEVDGRIYWYPEGSVQSVF